MNPRQAYRAWEDHLGEAIGQEEAEMVVTDAEQRVTRDDFRGFEQRLSDQLRHQAEWFTNQLEQQAERFTSQFEQQAERFTSQLEQQAHRLTSQWRRDLLLIFTGHFIALAGVLAAIT